MIPLVRPRLKRQGREKIDYFSCFLIDFCVLVESLQVEFSQRACAGLLGL